MSADLVLLDGKVITMNPKQATADAVAIKNGKIIQVGSKETVRKTIVKGTKIISLKGKTVIPGIIDTHIHVADFGRILSWLNLEGVGSIKELQDSLNQRVKETSKGKWIIGRGWNENSLGEKRFPTCFDLDKVSPDNPVVLYHASGQICVVNSRATELAGITQQIGSGIGKNQAGQLTGILRDEATNIVWNVIPAPDEEELVAATTLAFTKIVEAGITSIHWLILSPMEIAVIRKLNEQRKFSITVNVIAPANLFDEISKLSLKQSSSNENLQFSGFEIFADGYLAARTAALSEPYSDCLNEKGKLLCPQEEMAKTAAKITEAGFQLVIHAVGDKAVDAALNIIENRNATTRSKVRCRIEQGAVLNKKLIERLSEQHVVVSVQPRVVASEFSVWSAVDRLGSKRARWLFPLKTLVESGIRVVAGSDCPMEPLNPLLGIQ
jgi:predicted amidohydrolase YtcJ